MLPVTSRALTTESLTISKHEILAVTGHLGSFKLNDVSLLNPQQLYLFCVSSIVLSLNFFQPIY